MAATGPHQRSAAITMGVCREDSPAAGGRVPAATAVVHHAGEVPMAEVPIAVVATAVTDDRIQER